MKHLVFCKLIHKTWPALAPLPLSINSCIILSWETALYRTPLCFIYLLNLSTISKFLMTAMRSIKKRNHRTTARLKKCFLEHSACKSSIYGNCNYSWCSLCKICMPWTKRCTWHHECTKAKKRFCNCWHSIVNCMKMSSFYLYIKIIYNI